MRLLTGAPGLTHRHRHQGYTRDNARPDVEHGRVRARRVEISRGSGLSARGWYVVLDALLSCCIHVVLFGPVLTFVLARTLGWNRMFRVFFCKLPYAISTNPSVVLAGWSPKLLTYREKEGGTYIIMMAISQSPSAFFRRVSFDLL